VASILLRSFAWNSVFIAGFAAAVLFLPLVIAFLPETASFLIARRGPNSLARLNALLLRCGHPTLNDLPEAPATHRTAYAAIFSADQIGTTVRMTVCNLLYLVSGYYLISWMPQLIADAGFHASTASLVTASLNAAAIVGGVSLGFLARFLGLRRLTVGVVVASAFAMAAFGFTPPQLPLLVGAATILGIFTGGSAAGLYATLASLFSVEARSTGIGFVVGVGRIAAAIAPWLAGWLFSIGLGRDSVTLVFAICAAAAGAILVTVPNSERRNAPAMSNASVELEGS
jgi:MFS transporter, AAHS family, 4-hydroxybenzoate transporter